jgi:hypothetical protein
MRNTTTTITLSTKEEKELYVSNVWKILFAAYENVKGGLFFTSKVELISSTSLWKVVVRNGEVIAVTIYKAKHGLKLVALAINNAFKDIAKKALSKIIKADLKKCWMELSEAAERFVMKLGGDKYILPSHMVAKVINKEIRLSDDGVHYVRNIMGEDKEKVLLGTLHMS